ncbi:MAG: hypothetical protein AVDCRST_MAG39-1002 [uncultured Sphingomonadaceae bacterium]|uniref:Uncharacterized protein n=1 Tax=uncultured Sphingomonadaceae bacterium TaxID=169976 RepID=A0A6J4SA22_9SPHN|nr:MAG: hypothetical protein AVDCRST_MAG39-1002 [uncultured Sphingomonadaceae bacterium]
MQEGVDRVVAAVRAPPRGGVTLTHAPMPEGKHSTIYHPATTRAIRALFPPPPEPKP